MSQWWQWNGTNSRNSSPGLKGSRSATVIRSTSLKSDLNHIPTKAGEFDDDEEDDDVFVTADPIRNASVSRVKSAMIVSAVNPYCTGVRTNKNRLPNNPNKVKKTQSSESNSSSPSPPVSDDFGHNSDLPHLSVISNGHDQDSGYDGYCPGDKSMLSVTSSSENTSLTSEESHYGNLAMYNNHRPHNTRNQRPQSVYERQYGPVQQSLDSGRSQQPPQMISQATVVHLVNNRSRQTQTLNSNNGIPPPLPPRPAHYPSPTVPPPLPPTHLYSGVSNASNSKSNCSSSLGRTRRRDNRRSVLQEALNGTPSPPRELQGVLKKSNELQNVQEEPGKNVDDVDANIKVNSETSILK